MRRRPSKGNSRVNGVRGRGSAGRKVTKASCFAPTRSVYPPVRAFQATTNTTIAVTAAAFLMFL